MAKASAYNFYKLDGYELYRSRQLGHGREKQFLKDNNIKLTITLRGYHPEMAWWRNQKQAADESDATFISTEANSYHYPQKQQLLLMLAVIHNPLGVISDPVDASFNPSKYIFAENASTKDFYGNEISIKVNCRSGADRTGMFCALYIIEKLISEKFAFGAKQCTHIWRRAKKELSLRYGHIKFQKPVDG